MTEPRLEERETKLFLTLALALRRERKRQLLKKRPKKRKKRRLTMASSWKKILTRPTLSASKLKLRLLMGRRLTGRVLLTK